VLLYQVLYEIVMVYMYADEDHNNHAEILHLLKFNNEHVHLVREV
jgi:hypothetical protein